MDEIRGFAVICMVFYHAFFDLAIQFNLPVGGALLMFFMPLEPFFAGLFIFISGISSRFSKSNLIRGAKLFLISLGITAVTVTLDYFFSNGFSIWFGILHMLSVSMLLFSLFQKPLELINPLAGMGIFLFLFMMTFAIQDGYLGLSPSLGVPFPGGFYTNNWLAPLGFHGEGFYSADYFPLLPWMFIFFAGTSLGSYAKAGRFPNWTYPARVPFLGWTGRHALMIYILHQPVILSLLWLIDLIL